MATDADTSDGTVASSPDLPHPALAGFVLAVLLVQLVLFVVITTRYTAETLPTVLSASMPLTSGLAAVVLGYDATLVEGGSSWWNPRPWAWAFGMVPPGLNLGFCLGYLYRRREASGTATDGRWLRVLVPAIVFAHAGNGVVSLSPDATGPGLTLVMLLWLLASASFGVSIVALYYDLRFLDAVLETIGRRWTLRGYYWIPLVLVFAPLVIVYYLRRRRSLARVDGDPAQRLADTP